MLFSAIKDPDEKKDYGFNWVDWLGTDTIASSTWVVPSGTLAHGSPADSNDTTTTTIWFTGGTDGVDYDIVNRITTTAGRIAEAAFRLLCRASTN